MNNKSVAQQRKMIGYMWDILFQFRKKYVNIKRKMFYMGLPLKFHILAFYIKNVTDICVRIYM